MSALEGVFVLDLTRYLPGPYCGMLLADFGADVVKVEDRAGDPVRFIPPHVEDEGVRIALTFRAINGGKRSIGIDLKNPEGRDVLRRLAARADVLLDGFRPGVLERLGLGWDALSKENPRLVWASITGYGLEGPDKDRAGHDLNYQALAGSLHANREVRGDHAPIVPGVQVADLSGALAGFSGVLLALLAREKTGRGQRVDAAMLRSTVALQPFQLVPPARGEKAVTAETLSGRVPCYRVYRTRDGRGIAVGALEPKFWDELCDLVGKPEWVSRAMDPDLIPEVEALFATRTFEEWRILEGAECCVAGALTPEEVAAHPQVQALGLIMDGPDGKAARVAPPVSLLGTRERPRVRAPLGPGEHTDEVLRERLALKDDAVLSLRARGAVFGGRAQEDR